MSPFSKVRASLDVKKRDGKVDRPERGHLGAVILQVNGEVLGKGRQATRGGNTGTEGVRGIARGEGVPYNEGAVRKVLLLENGGGLLEDGVVCKGNWTR